MVRLQVGAHFLVAVCPACGQSLFVKFGSDETRVRCLRCRATPISLSLIDVVSKNIGSLAGMSVYEASSRGAVVAYMREHALSVATSEYFPGVHSGDYKDGIQCQNLEALAFESESFDLCTSTEVFEHVGEDLRAFREILRVLRPGGTLAFTVPLYAHPVTVQRAIVENGKTVQLLPASFHGDRLTGANSVLVFREYGLDIVGRVRSAGFSSVELQETSERWFDFSRRVIVARK